MLSVISSQLYMFKCQKQIQTAAHRNHILSIVLRKKPVYLNDPDKIELIINLVTFQINTSFYKETRANNKKTTYLCIKRPLKVEF